MAWCEGCAVPTNKSSAPAKSLATMQHNTMGVVYTIIIGTSLTAIWQILGDDCQELCGRERLPCCTLHRPEGPAT